ncbi:MAG: HEPN family nuclease [Caldilineaceae bacterium]
MDANIHFPGGMAIAFSLPPTPPISGTSIGVSSAVKTAGFTGFIAFLEHFFCTVVNGWTCPMEIQKFNIDFVKRTVHLLAYQDEHDMTNLLNCTLGLVMLPFGRIRDDRPPWNQMIETIPLLQSLHMPLFNPIKGYDKRTDNPIYYPKTVGAFLRRIRNGIAQQEIEPQYHNDKFDGVIIRNRFGSKLGECDLEVHFSQDQLREFALFIAQSYIEASEE